MTESPGESASKEWIPDACTLPSVEQPLRTTEFADLFARDVVSVTQESDTKIVLELRPDPASASRAAALAAKEVECCSFFRFQLTIAEGQVRLVIETSPEHAGVLGGLLQAADGI